MRTPFVSKVVNLLWWLHKHISFITLHFMRAVLYSIWLYRSQKLFEESRHKINLHIRLIGI